ncbi:N-acetylmuramoyl-L-alanine amidase family protein [Bacillus horti]|uniref:N-acetylmuramoyl-L-alanine amidase n=1 Tax=Caldalkalibacillus horti TaxID=77523 RepID=A0ABT9VXE0_9BACI|nr:N-acetylmuramoyl-L-alanine amidase [Bacillus horti]MDQ0165658.1 N-acetylmuramoyl-L-alanine amidase [Bacillus horti]
MKIMIDPGHGGHDPGAVGNGLQEKTLNLTIARHIRDILVAEYQGVEVRMTRDSDVFIGLSQRAALANSWGANYFMSIHINAGGGTGFESYIYNTRPASSVRAQDLIHPQIVQAMGVTDRGKKSANFAVLRETNMPAILTENLFIDRAADATRLANATFLRTIARGHVNGLERAFNLRKGSGGGGNVYRVIVDGTQVGAYGDHQNILNEIRRNVGTARNILVQRT